MCTVYYVLTVNGLQVSVNGRMHEFRHRLSMHAVQALQVKGGCQLFLVDFTDEMVCLLLLLANSIVGFFGRGASPESRPL